MSEMTTNRLWDIGPPSSPSPYARMIPGTAAVPPPRAFAASTAATKPHLSTPPSQEKEAVGVARERTSGSRRPVLPDIALDRFTFYELVAADLSVVMLGGAATASFLPAWGLPWAYLPVFAALVALFGICQGVHTRSGDPAPRGITSALAQSTLLATGHVFIAARREISVLTGSGEPAPRGSASAVAKSTLLVTGLVFIAAGREISVRTDCRIFGGNLA